MTVRPRLLVSLLVAALAGPAIWLAAAAEAATMSSSTYASQLVSLVNQARSQHGLAPLTVTSGTSQVAYGWTSHLASVQALSHNPNLAAQLESHGSPNWTSLGENVGVGVQGDPRQLFDAYMNSPAHRANILGAKYRYVGIGEIYSGGRAWNTMDFVDSYGSATRTVSAPAPAPAPKSTTRPVAPRTTTTTTTHASSVPVARASHAPVRPVARKSAVKRSVVARSTASPRATGFDGSVARADWSAAPAAAASVLGVERTRTLSALLDPDPHRTPVVALALLLIVVVARRWLRVLGQPA